MSILEARLKNIKSQDLLEVSALNLFKKIERSLTILAMAPLVGLEGREREKRLEERLKRSQQRHNFN
jgi:hypothetical protein